MITELIDNFYEKIKKFKAGRPKDMLQGQIAWVPTYILQPIPRICKVERSEPRSHNSIKITEIRNMKSFDFTSHEHTLPIPQIPLKEGEELILVKSKNRPCIFFISSGVLKIQKHWLTNDFYFLPMYSTATGETRTGYSPELVERIKKCEYSHLIYLPPYPKGKIILENTIPSKESIIRLDRMFCASPIVPTVTPTDLKIHQDFIEIIKEHFIEYFLNRPGEILQAVRESN